MRRHVFVLSICCLVLAGALGLTVHRAQTAETLLERANAEISTARASIKGLSQSLEAVIGQQAQLQVICNQKIISYIDEALKDQPTLTRAAWRERREDLRKELP